MLLNSVGKKISTLVLFLSTLLDAPISHAVSVVIDATWRTFRRKNVCQSFQRKVRQNPSIWDSKKNVSDIDERLSLSLSVIVQHGRMPESSLSDNGGLQVRHQYRTLLPWCRALKIIFGQPPPNRLSCHLTAWMFFATRPGKGVRTDGKIRIGYKKCVAIELFIRHSLMHSNALDLMLARDDTLMVYF